MKRFVIKSPSAGRRTVTLATHEYVRETGPDGRSRGATKTVYLGSFSLDLNPDLLRCVEHISAGETAGGITLRPDTYAAGEPFTLDAEDLEQIREWLVAHGTYIKRRESLEQYRIEEARVRAEERAALASQIEVELRARLTTEIRAAFEAELAAKRVNALDAAAEMLRQAGQVVVEEAGRLKAGGPRVSARRRAVADEEVKSARQALLARTLRLRKEVFAEFEEACKQAGLMTRKSSAKRKPVAEVKPGGAGL